MRKLAVSMLCLTVAASLGGCNHRAGQHAAAAKKLNQALALMNQANRGYAPADQAHKRPIPLQQYRQQTLKEAVAPLQAVLQTGSTDQQVAARRLLSQIDASHAGYLAAQATGRYGQFQSASGVLISDALAVTSAAGRAEDLKVNNRDAVRSLQGATLDKLNKRKQTLQRQIKTEQQAYDQQQQHVTQLQQEANALMSQAQKVRQKGFVAQGNKKYDLLDKAAALRSQSNEAAYHAAQHQVSVASRSRAIALLKKKQALVDAAIKIVKDRIDSLQSQQKQMDDAQTKARQQEQSTGQTVLKKFKTLDNVYQSGVQQPYSNAESQIDDAVNLLTRAHSLAHGNQRQNVTLDLLSRYIDQANILAAHARATEGYADLLKLVHNAAGKQLAKAATALDHTLTRLRSQQKSLIQKANNAVAAGQKLAASLSQGASHDTASIVSSQQQVLSQYKSELQHFRQGA